MERIKDFYNWRYGVFFKGVLTDNSKTIEKLLNKDFIIIYEDGNKNLLAPCNISLKDFYTVTKAFFPKSYTVNNMLKMEYHMFNIK